MHPKGAYLALKKQLFYSYEINDLYCSTNHWEHLQTALFPGNAMRPKGAYPAQGERGFERLNCSF